MHNTALALSLALLLSACATPTPDMAAAAPTATRVKVEASEESAGCSVYMYRNKTSFQRFSPEKPFVYVGDEKVGKLGVGNSICLNMPDGKYTVSIKAPIMFMPGNTVAKLEIEVVAGSPMYIRYSKDFTGIVLYGSVANATGSDSLRIVTETQWRDRL